MADKTDKNIKIALGLGAIVVGAAVLYRMVSGGNTDDPNKEPRQDTEQEDSEDDYADPEINNEAISAAIVAEKLNEMEKDNGQGLIPFPTFMKILMFITKQSKVLLKDQKDRITKKRREAFKNKDDDLYKEIVKKTLELDNNIMMTISQVVLDECDINQMSFQNAQGVYSQNPQTAEMVQAAMMGKMDAPQNPGAAPKLSRAQTSKHLKLTGDLSEVQMKKALTMRQPDPTNEEEMMELINQTMVDQQRMQDELYFQSGGEFEDEEFQASLMYYLQRDPSFKMEFDQFQRKLQMMQQNLAMQMGGGMGGR